MVLKHFVPAICWLVSTTILLTMPGNDLPDVGFLDIPYLDKVVHLGLCLVLTLLFCFPFRRSALSRQAVRSWIISIVLYGIAYGIIMEFVQKYAVRNRSFDVVDIVFDAIGCVIGGWIAWRLWGKKIGPDRNRGRNQN